MLSVVDWLLARRVLEFSRVKMDDQGTSSVHKQSRSNDRIQAQIEYEEREIKRLEIELSLRKRQRDRDSSVMLAEIPTKRIQSLNASASIINRGQQQQKMMNNPDDFLDALDALASRSSEAVSLSMSLRTPCAAQQQQQQQQQKHVTDIDPDILRLQAQVSGICFSAIKSVSDGPGSAHVHGVDGEVKRTYELCGFVYGDGRSNFRFRAVANISIVNRVLTRPYKRESLATNSFVDGEETRGLVEGLTVTFFDSNDVVESSNLTRTQCSFPKEELEELSRLAKQNKNLPRLFQDLVSFASFDYRRRRVLSDIAQNYAKKHFSILSAHSFRLSSISASRTTSHPFFMELKWQWKFSHLTKGGEELVLDSMSDAVRTSDSRASQKVSTLLNELDELGLDSLVESVGFEEAIIILLKAMGPERVKKRRSIISSECTILESMSPPANGVGNKC